MASVMSAVLLTAAIVGLGYSCESQAQSPAAHSVHSGLVLASGNSQEQNKCLTAAFSGG